MLLRRRKTAAALRDQAQTPCLDMPPRKMDADDALLLQEEMDCPLCMEEMDISDLNFKPCPCGYQARRLMSTTEPLDNLSAQICRFCWHHIKENLNGRCPACRTPYDDSAVKFKPLKPEECVTSLKTEFGRAETERTGFADCKLQRSNERGRRRTMSCSVANLSPTYASSTSRKSESRT